MSLKYCLDGITKAKKLLGCPSQVSFDIGFVEMVEWLGGQLTENQPGDAGAQLAGKGLLL